MARTALHLQAGETMAHGRCTAAACRTAAARRTGFSLTETLVALLLVGILGTMIVAGVPAARNVYNNLLRKENAGAVCTTVTNRISAELRDASYDSRGFYVSHSDTALKGLRISFDARAHTFSDGHVANIVYVSFYDETGSLINDPAGKPEESASYNPKPLLPADTYVLGLQAQVSIARAADGKTADLTVNIYYDDITKPLATENVTVALAQGGK